MHQHCDRDLYVGPDTTTKARGPASTAPTPASFRTTSSNQPIVWQRRAQQRRCLYLGAFHERYARAANGERIGQYRIASCFYGGNDSQNFGPNQFSIDVNLTDGNTHQLALYLSRLGSLQPQRDDLDSRRRFASGAQHADVLQLWKRRLGQSGR